MALAARVIVVPPFAWLWMLIAGALGNHVSYWDGVLLVGAAVLVLDGARGLWSRSRKRGGRRG